AIEIEKGKQLLLTNIITGYQKVQRSAISPFRQMFSAFDRDCFEADKLFIIGYSFGDEHINDIIRNSRKYNTHVEIILVNPVFDDRKFMVDFLLHWGRYSGQIYKNEGNYTIVSPNYGVRIIQKEFGNFLNEQKSEK
ncbi:MAG TPA: SIR2 family protein, partial [Chitinophagaceae bacterium]|nr:SIR2 family protein [Chitinophagaceae bacterium]